VFNAIARRLSLTFIDFGARMSSHTITCKKISPTNISILLQGSSSASELEPLNIDATQLENAVKTEEENINI
jgi:hypothetical protein